MKVVAVFLLFVSFVHGRPGNVDEGKRDERELKYLTYAPNVANLPLEPREVSEVQRLAYYGGALGRYLVIHPSGQMYITGERRVPQGHKDEEDVGVAEENPSDTDDSVAINQPPENASIAEAKPVAVSIAGVGGVASAQPVGQAVVGPGGLAVSRPIATAVAGVPGAENLVLSPGKYPGSKPHHVVYSVYQPQTVYYYPILYY